MSQFYTKDQINQIATVIGNEIKTTKDAEPVAAADYASFISLLDAAIGSSGDLGLITCIPANSAWSNPITLDMITPASSFNGLQVSFGSPDMNVGKYMDIDVWIDMTNINNIVSFLEAVYEASRLEGYFMEIEDLGDGSARFRFTPFVEPSQGSGEMEEAIYFTKRGGLYPQMHNYYAENAGTNGETIIDLSYAFDSDITVVLCRPKSSSPPPIMMT